MSTRGKAIIAGAIGGMVGGVVMALALMMTNRREMEKASIKDKVVDRMESTPLAGAAARLRRTDRKAVAQNLAMSALLGGIYGIIRSGLRLPGILFGPAFGLVTYGLGWIGLGPAIDRTPGPWSDESDDVVPALVTHTAFGMVADFVSERVEAAMGAEYD